MFSPDIAHSLKPSAVNPHTFSESRWYDAAASIKVVICGCYVSDTLFATASDDGILKFWMIGRAGATSKYIPKFDRADSPIHTIAAADETALTVGRDRESRYV